MLTAAIKMCENEVRTMSLGWKLAARMVLLLVVASGILFLPAGTWKWGQGWGLLGAYFIPSVLGFSYLLLRSPEAVERRLRTKEQVSEQKLLIRLFQPFFLLALLLPGFDHRLGWSRSLVGEPPFWLEAFSLAMVVGGFLFVFWVLKVNDHAGRTIVVEEGQRVISTGPYAVVRHPMYTGSVVLFLGTPLALGSWVALPAFLLLVPFYIVRLLNEEKVLRAELPGYTEYCQRTRFHLIPCVW
jgi:protein-S-isoprenylcysteine O-methyltransferase Ste14